MKSMDDKVTIAIRDAAAEWVVRMGATHVSHAEKSELATWLRRSPMHVKEYLLAEVQWQQLSEVAQADSSDVSALLAQGESSVVELLPERSGTAPESAPPRWPSVLRRSWRIPAAAAAVLLLFAATHIAARWIQRIDSNSYTTGIGEQRQIVLDDGSKIELNTRSRLRVAFDDVTRDVYLQEGEAFFEVAKDVKRPFRVLGETAIVRAIGTQFNVYARPTGTVVTVVEGRVTVVPVADVLALETRPVEVDAGSSAQIIPSANTKVASARVSTAIAWRQRRLVFEDESLAVVASEFNRYNTRQLKILDAALAAQRISGTFDANQPNSLVEFLTQHGEVRAETSPAAIVLSSASVR